MVKQAGTQPTNNQPANNQPSGSAAGSQFASAVAAWICTCGKENDGNFCSNCGKPRPAHWFCPDCGKENSGNFCVGCGRKKPE